MLNIITVTKDDLIGLMATLQSTLRLREEFDVRQIVVDSSGEDVKKEILALIGSEKNVQYHWQEPKGISAAFNHGLKCADQKWVWFLNGGDKVLKDLDLNLYMGILAQCRSDVLIYDIKFTNRISQKPPLSNIWPPLFNWICHPGTIVKRDVLTQCGGFDEEYKIAMDAELWLRLLSKDATTDLISIPIAEFAGGGLSDNLPKTANEVNNLIKKHGKMLFKKWLGTGHGILSAVTHFRRISKNG